MDMVFKHNTICQNISSKQYIIHFLIHTQYMPAKFWDNQNLIILEKLCNFKKKHLELLNSFLKQLS